MGLIITSKKKPDDSMKNTSNAVLDQYLTHVTALFASFERWSADFGLQVERGETTINEERHGQYQAHTLRLNDVQGKRIAEVVPFGESVIGALGRVDLVGDYGKREKIVYLNEGGPTMTTRIQVGTDGTSEQGIRKLYRGVDTEGWFWLSPSPIRRAYPISREVLADLLSAVTGHEFKY